MSKCRIMFGLIHYVLTNCGVARRVFSTVCLNSTSLLAQAQRIFRFQVSQNLIGEHELGISVLFEHWSCFGDSLLRNSSIFL